jgi:CTP:molybdopterin cytidylyltransferase MocA
MTSSPHPARIAGIVPAAGMSRRMGRPKVTLPYRGGTMVGAVVRSLLDAEVDEVLVVTRPELAAQLDLPTNPRVETAINDDPASEMFDSIRIGLAATMSRYRGRRSSTNASYYAKPADGSGEPGDALAGILVVPADMPDVAVDTYRMCLDLFQLDPGRIIIAGCDGRRGHPVVIPRALLATPDQRTGGPSIKELVDANRRLVRFVETNDAGVLRDVDTPGDYDALSSIRQRGAAVDPTRESGDQLIVLRIAL